MKDIGFSDDARLEINVNDCGVFVIGNVEGYLALARFCTYLAEIHSAIRLEPYDEDKNTVFGYGGYHLSHEVTSKAVKEGHYMFSPGPIKRLQPKQAESCIQDVIFHVSDEIGPNFWKGQVESKSASDWINRYAPFARKESDELNEQG